MNTKIEIKTIWGAVIFAYETNNNTIAKTLEQAISSREDLRYTDLHGANLYGADLRNADLCFADLCYADLRNADLRDANLYDANLYGADLRGARNIPFIPMACPDEGEFIGWKNVDGYLIKLRIPKDARRSSATTRKCRCDKAKVLSIVEIGTGKKVGSITNTAYEETTYKVGKMVYPDSFDEDRWNECSNGIHFFINKQEA